MGSSRTSLAVSTVIFTVRPTGPGGRHELWLPLVRRVREPYRHVWALPGGPLQEDRDLEDAAAWYLRLTVGLGTAHLEQLATFGGLDRSEGSDERVVTVVYWVALPAEDAAAAGEEDLNVAWLRATALPALAFDHSRIVAHALDRLRDRIADPTVARSFLPPVFTVAQLREVHEAILGHALDAPNFRRHVLRSGRLQDTGERVPGTPHRPPALYRFAAEDTPALFRSDPIHPHQETP
ncbi:NUDIX domain-containing protein [Kocuria sp.]|uniref:NUDIX hydrolase n=1 Tax=Kocuria sp. TaxID=1871328 RepID=UPI0026DC94EB|nr:NUDIX domain-containing protein [Kocuria sp.]MDO4917933.1 NUDIX domain-containing protein [Kocuria sp.]